MREQTFITIAKLGEIIGQVTSAKLAASECFMQTQYVILQHQNVDDVLNGTANVLSYDPDEPKKKRGRKKKVKMAIVDENSNEVNQSEPKSRKSQSLTYKIN